jgi:uncharacterized membrane protein
VPTKSSSNQKPQPTKQQQTATIKTMAAFKTRTGILPPPDELERDERLCPGITDRLLITYEKQVDHRIKIEETVIKGDSVRAARGQILAFIIVLTCVIGGFYLIAIGKDGYGIASILVPIATLAGIFYKANNQRNKERKEKRNIT